MKTDIPIRILKLIDAAAPRPSFVAAAIIIAAALVTRPTFAVPPSEIDIIEDSPTMLSATYNGLTTGVSVVNTGPDQWTVTFPTTGTFDSGPFAWLEPGSLNLYNVATVVSATEWSISSDANLPTGASTAADGGLIVVGSGAPGEIEATFHDRAAAAEIVPNGFGVPETGSTVGLLFLSLIVLLATRRICSARLG